jgi:alpha-beta hydrolase superfamily lysophospholipase
MPTGNRYVSLASSSVDDVRRLVRRIESDFADPRLEFPGIALRPVSEWDDVHPPASDLVAISGGHSFRVDGDLDEEQAAVEVASRLQDDAIDQLGAPWPTLVLPGGREAVLEPRLSSDGAGVWATKAGYRCPIGQLQAVFGALHLIK